MFNKCEERCECKKGKLTSCYRVRKEFTKMTIDDRKRYINTYKLASVDPVFKKDFEKFIDLHSTAGDQERIREVFFPFRRCFWLRWKTQNRLSCNYTLLGLEQKHSTLVERNW